MGVFHYRRTSVPYVTVDKMKKISRLMPTQFQIQIQIMENAGSALASLATQQH